jgi:cyclopropane fatty-acyl-phospholipid synthase-like methyltransferase
VSKSGMDLSPGFRYWSAIMPMFDNLEESLRTGSPPINMYEWLADQPGVSRDFQDYMVPLAKFALGEVTARLKIPPGAKRLLDIGGGHAMYSIAFCRQNLSLTATIFDSEEALKPARKNISDTGLEKAIRVQADDLLKDDLGEGYDVALLFNICHGLSEQQNITLLEKTAKALNPGGIAVILEQFGTNLPMPMSRAANNILEMSYYHLLGGQVYSHEQVENWLCTAGYSNLKRINLRKVPGNSLVIGVTKG